MRSFIAVLSGVALVMGCLASDLDAKPRKRRAKAGAGKLYDADGSPGRRLTWRTLKGSTDAVATERAIMAAHGIADIPDFNGLAAVIAAGKLVQVKETVGYAFSKTFGQKAETPDQKPKYAYLHPAAAKLLDDVFGGLAGELTAEFAKLDPDAKGLTNAQRRDFKINKGKVVRFSVDSMVRDAAYQQRLKSTNANAIVDSVHQSGLAFDVLLQDPAGNGLGWVEMTKVRKRLTSLELTDTDGNAVTKDTPANKKLIQATEEMRRGKPSCWHVVVSPAYIAYAARAASSVPSPPAPTAAPAAPTPAPVVTVAPKPSR